MLHDETNYLHFIILKPIFHEINKINANFQAIGNAMEDLKGLIFFLSRKILKATFTTNIDDIIKNINNELAYLEINKIDFGIEQVLSRDKNEFVRQRY